VLGVAVDELRDERVTLSTLWGPTGESLADRLAGSPTNLDRRRILARAVGDRVNGATCDAPVLAAARALAAGDARVAAVAEQVGLSDRHLQRRFAIQVGYGPKTFHRVMRFRRFLNGDRNLGLAAMALAAGYADQAHLTRECRRLAERTPAELLLAG
jgi:AraC-like DNA-binding protein